MSEPEQQKWYDIEPADATHLNLLTDTHIEGPLAEDGTVCPWPWEPQQYGPDVPMGMFHCQYCGSMVVAGMRHVDYRDLENDLEAALADVKDDTDGLV